MITVCCFLWSDASRQRDYAFAPEHVGVLRSMIARHLTMPHEFVCITDRPFDADGIRCAPLDWSKHVPGTCAVKLMLWHPHIATLLGRRILCLDIDAVVTGNIDHIAGRTEDVVLWHNPNFGTLRRAFYQGSLQLLTAGARPEVWKDFDPKLTPGWVNRRYGGMEQAWLSERLSHDEAFWDERDGVYGAGRLGGKGVYSELPDNACLVFTPGNRAPWQPETQEKHPWIKEHYR